MHIVETWDIIRTRADVDKALIEYAAKNGYDLTILKGHSWEPVVLLDGRKLWGMAHYGRFGARLYLYKSWEDSQYSTFDNIAIKRIANLFKKHKNKKKP